MGLGGRGEEVRIELDAKARPVGNPHGAALGEADHAVLDDIARQLGRMRVERMRQRRRGGRKVQIGRGRDAELARAMIVEVDLEHLAGAPELHASR